MNRKKNQPCFGILSCFFPRRMHAKKLAILKVDNWEKYQQQGTITIGFDNTFVPMGFEEKNGQYVDLILILAQAVSENLGSRFSFNPLIGI